MKRRAAMFSLLGAAGALGLEARGAQGLSEDTVRQMLRLLADLDPLPGEEAQIRAFLLSFRWALASLPEREPAVGFDPEVDG